jgi:PD-(D/E)XK nuclease superfamily
MKQKAKPTTPFTNEELETAFGAIPSSGLTKRVRFHQGWWRLNVLNKIKGEHPTVKSETVCNTVLEGEESGINFLTPTTLIIVKETLKGRTKEDGGIIEEGRLYNNLLSSQPLCFNFFAELENNKELGLAILQNWWNGITKLNKVLFEYSPPVNYTKDSSAFDVAFDVQFGDKRGFIGVECKYTDTFSYQPSKPKGQKIEEPYYGDIGNKNYDTFFEVFSQAIQAFKVDYFDFVKSKKYNQLFRNQLMAEAILINKNDFEIVKTGLFCFEQDKEAVKTGGEFQGMLTGGTDTFTTITYRDFIEAAQQLNLTWEQREWTMLLWARYCGMRLSEEVKNQLLEKN